jgi:hypothetical protein
VDGEGRGWRKERRGIDVDGGRRGGEGEDVDPEEEKKGEGNPKE